jgi:hypothetical protein
MVGLLPSSKGTKRLIISEVEIEVKRPDNLLEEYRVFIQDRGPGSRQLPVGSSILVHVEVSNSE